MNNIVISQNAEILMFYFSEIFGISDVIIWLSFVGDGLRLVCECVYIVNSR